MVALVTGAGGQLATELVKCAPVDVVTHALSVDELDITNAEQVDATFTRLRPAFVFNAAAYTAVDAAQDHEFEADRLNHRAVALLAHACTQSRAKLIHVSTDYVFAGDSMLAYHTDHVTAPQSIYGRSKRAGELAALQVERALVVRTAWLYSAHGKNFMKTMIRLMETRPEVRVVSDQVGTPTHAAGLASALWTLARGGAEGIHHWTDSGVASWFDFALAIRDEAVLAGFATANARIIAIPSSEYPTPAPRPACAILAKEKTWQAHGSPAQHWREGLRTVLREYAASSAAQRTLETNSQ